MAAKNPFRVSDLIAKYGWKVMPYLSNLGPQLLAEAQVLFVDSGHTNALDADDTEHGHSFEKPLATLDYAIGLCTAGERSVILEAPGHIDTLASAQIDFDVNDITVIGIGEGTNRPKVVFGHANSSVVIGANNIHLINLRFVPSVADVLIGVDIETGKTGTIIEDCEFAEGDDIAIDEFIIGLALKATCTDTRVKNCLFRTGIAADGATAAIQLTGISDNVIIEKSRFIGNWVTAAIYNDTGICTDLLIDDCTMKVADGRPGINVDSTTTGIIRNVCIESTGLAVDSMIVAADMAWFNNYGVTVDGSAAEIIGGGEVNAALIAHGLDHLITLADGTTVRPASVVEDSILAKLMGSPDPATIATFDNTKHSLEAIGDDTDLILEDTITISGSALPEDPVVDSLARFVAGGGTALGQQLPTNMSLIDLIGDFTGVYNATEQDDNIKASLDLAHTALNKVMGSAVGQHSPFSRINHSFGTVYYVDKATGSDSNDGLSPANAFLTIGAAITASNLTAGSYLQNAIYVNANTYSEDLTTYPKNCDVIGIGSKCRITGNHTGTGLNIHWHNLEFRPGGASQAVFQATGACHGLEFHYCRFKNISGNATIGIETEVGSDGVIDNCWFGGNNVIPIGIRFGEITLNDTGVNHQNWRITNNYICATAVGIQFDAGNNATSNSYQNLVKDNHITGQNPNNSDQQLLIGIDDTRTDGHSGVEIVGNTISAVDAIHHGLEDAQAEFTCIGNRINEAGSSGWEDA